MRRYSLPLASLAALVLMLNQPVAAQDGGDKNKIKQYDEIIIRKKSDKDGKVVVEIKDGNVTINGKPLADFEDDNISVRKGHPGRPNVAIQSPFRSNGGGWNFNGDNLNFNELTNAPFLGVATEDSKQGAIVEEVTKGSAAEKAGLKKGDVITKIGDDAVFTHDEVTKAVKKHKPEDKVAIVYKRDGKEQKATVTLGKRSSSMSFSSPDMAPNLEGLQGLQSIPGLRNFDFNFDDNGPRVFSMGRPRLGIRAQDTEDGKGVKVLDVDDESIAEKAGIKENDVITEFDGKVVNSADELSAAARESREKPTVTVKLTRDGKTQTLELKTPKKLKTANL